MDARVLIEVGDDLALGLLNSTTRQGGAHVDLLGDGAAYVRWLRQAGFVDEGDETAIRASFSPVDLDPVAAEAREMREWLRSVVADWAARDAVDAPLEGAVRDRLNGILSLEHRFTEVGEQGIAQRCRWEVARQLLTPPAAAAAHLLTEEDPKLVRHCEGIGCSMWFYDRTKSHRRRWCSMALCGNRAKARAHRERQSERTTA